MFTPVLIRMPPVTIKKIPSRDCFLYARHNFINAWTFARCIFLFLSMCSALNATALKAESNQKANSDQSAAPAVSTFSKTAAKARDIYDSAATYLNESNKKLYAYADKTYGSLEIMVEGIDALSHQDFEALLPVQKSFYWWINNKSEIVANLKQQPLIENAQIEGCPSNSPPRCFLVRIKERVPTLWVKAESANGMEVRFLIADDGAVLSILSADQNMSAVSRFDRKLLARFSSTALTTLPVLDARNLANISDASQQLFNRAVNLISIIKNESGFEVYEFRFLSSDQLEVEFESQPFKLVFSIDNSDSIRARIAAQLRRLDKIMESKPQLASRAISINLGLEREAFAVLIKG